MEKLMYQGKQLKLHKRATVLLELLKEAQHRQYLLRRIYPYGAKELTTSL
jgi:hypothetical protein